MVEYTGVQATQFKLVNGYETNISINVISTFLLGLFILPKLQESALKFGIRPTLTIVASDTHYFAPVCSCNRLPNGVNSGVTANQ
jgi:retinol dehydrogenase 12